MLHCSETQCRLSPMATVAGDELPRVHGLSLGSGLRFRGRLSSLAPPMPTTAGRERPKWEWREREGGGYVGASWTR